jgi:hypothetical protein
MHAKIIAKGRIDNGAEVLVIEVDPPAIDGR